LNKIIKIYFWQIISIIFNFATVFIVTPYLSLNPSLFGIYSIVMAAYIFLSYADFGFLSAGMKYASESFARNEREEEMKIIGFAGFIFLFFILLYAITMICISFNPRILVGSLLPGIEYKTAQQLLFILGIFSPTFILQRLLLIIFAVRLEDYLFQRILIISSSLKIASVFLFFKGDDYNIVGYFLCSQIIGVLAVVAGLLLAKRRLNYDLKFFFKSISFSSEMFKKTKGLAFSSIFLTICWIGYYELDPFVIGKIFGASKVSIYAIALTLMTYFRSLFGILFSPFTAKFNHYIANGESEKLSAVVQHLLIVTIPITLFPVISVFLTADSFIRSWVGDNYLEAISIAKLLVLSFIFSFITYPAGILMMASVRIKLIYISNGILPIIFWLGIFFTYQNWGIYSFGIFKLIAFTFSAIFLFINMHKILNLGICNTIRKVFLPLIMPILTIIGCYFFLKQFLPYEKGKANLFLCIILNGLIVLTGTVMYFITSTEFRDFLINGKNIVMLRLGLIKPSK